MKKQTTKTALSSLDFALSRLVDEPQRPDEFTAQEFVEASNLSPNQAHWRLKSMVASGELISRKARIGGKQTNLYSRPK